MQRLSDLLFLDGAHLMRLPVIERKERLAAILPKRSAAVRYSDHIVGDGARFHAQACKAGTEGIVSKRINAPNTPGNSGHWQKTKCLNREEFVVVGFNEPEGSRPYFGALLLGYYDDDGRLLYTGRVGTGFTVDELRRIYAKLKPLLVEGMPLAEPPPRTNRFGSPLEPSGGTMMARRGLRHEARCQRRHFGCAAVGYDRLVFAAGLRRLVARRPHRYVATLNRRTARMAPRVASKHVSPRQRQAHLGRCLP
jgi:hypothetical protein